MKLTSVVAAACVLTLTTAGCSGPAGPRLVTPSPAPSVQPVTRGAQPWIPARGASFQVQYAGRLDLGVPAEVYDLDYQTASADDVARLRARGVHVVCYFNAGAYENWRPDKDAFPRSVIGKPLEGWAGENWLDVNQSAALLPIMERRMDDCVEKGFEAVDPDNVDGYTQDSGFAISPEAQVRYIRALAAAAHERGLSMGLKNDTDQLGELAGDVDFAVNEECVAYGECGVYRDFLTAGKAVFNIEYAGDAASVCPGRPEHLTTVIKDRQLGAQRVAC